MRLIRRNLSTPESRAFWAHVERVAAEVETWPPWKRGAARRALFDSCDDQERWDALHADLLRKEERS